MKFDVRNREFEFGSKVGTLMKCVVLVMKRQTSYVG